MAVAAQIIERKPWYGMNWLRKERRIALHLRDDWTCQYCGKQLKNAGPHQIHLDHLIPRSWFERAGLPVDNSNENLVTACAHCNDSRKDQNWREFAARHGAETVLRIETAIQQYVNIPLGKAILRGELGD